MAFELGPDRERRRSERVEGGCWSVFLEHGIECACDLELRMTEPRARKVDQRSPCEVLSAVIL